METRNYQSGASATPPTAPVTPSVGYPSNGNPASGQQPTQPGAYWFYKIGEELRNVIVNAGLSPDDSNLAQLLTALKGGGLFDTQNTADNSRKVATTAFVHDAMPDLSTYASQAYVDSKGLTFNGFVSYLNSAQLQNTAAGKLIIAEGNISLSLPAANVMSGGKDVISISNLGIHKITIDKGANTGGIYAYGLQSASSITLNPGSTIQLVTDGNNWLMLNGCNSIGTMQSRVDVTQSRALNTIFTNPTTLPIFVEITCTHNTNNPVYVYIDGYINLELTNQYNKPCAFFVVMPDENYKIVANGESIERWIEVRR